MGADSRADIPVAARFTIYKRRIIPHESLLYSHLIHSVFVARSHPNGSARVQDFEMTPPLQPAAAVSRHPDYSEPEDDREEERPEPRPAPRSRSREGLPPAYRMRHAPHYVEQLMGDTPLQTVRQILIDQIDSPAELTDTADLDELAASIRQFGVLQPLLVTQGTGGRFDLLAGGKRLAAAHLARLQAVPCLLVHADEARASELRTQAAVVAARREREDIEQKQQAAAISAVAEASDSGANSSVPALHVLPGAETSASIQSGKAESQATIAQARPFDTGLSAAVDEIGGALDFVTALMPAASTARSSFQQRVIADVIKVERRRAAALTAAASSLADNTPLHPEQFDWLEFTEQLRGDVALESRLRNVDVEWLHSLKLRPAAADKLVVMTAWRAILHAALGISVEGDRISVALATPRVRPAIILTVSVHTRPRFAPAPGEVHGGAAAFLGGPGELMLASARAGARRHGGRLTVSTTEDSVTIEFVAPQSLGYWQ
jgi:ParB/Sulfiredoxin domain